LPLGVPRNNGPTHDALAAVVATLTVNPTEEVPAIFTDGCEIEHVAEAGTPVHARVTAPVNPPMGDACKL
jgi:hypothetical protein